MSMRSDQPRDALVFALDGGGDLAEAMDWVARLHGHVGMFKVGKEAFTRHGPELVSGIQARGGRVFLDLKYHDIPHTVAGAADAAASLGVAMFNVHALGGLAMMQAARDGARRAAERLGVAPPVVLAVTVLTSLGQGDLSALGFRETADRLAASLARMAKDAGLSGVVASPREAETIRRVCGKDFLIVTPGIRGPGEGAGDDQKRTWSPREAVRAGADFLVVGRPIQTAADPGRRADEIVAEIAAGRAGRTAGA